MITEHTKRMMVLDDLADYCAAQAKRFARGSIAATYVTVERELRDEMKQLQPKEVSA